MMSKEAIIEANRLKRLREVIARSGMTLQEFAGTCHLTMGQINGLLYNNVKLTVERSDDIAESTGNSRVWLWQGDENTEREIEQDYEDQKIYEETPQFPHVEFCRQLVEIGEENNCAKIECEGIKIEFYMNPTKFDIVPTKEPQEFDENILFHSAG